MSNEIVLELGRMAQSLEVIAGELTAIREAMAKPEGGQLPQRNEYYMRQARPAYDPGHIYQPGVKVAGYGTVSDVRHYGGSIGFIVELRRGDKIHYFSTRDLFTEKANYKVIP